MQRGMKEVDSKHERSAGCELDPSGVNDLAGHLVSDDYGAEGIDPCGRSIQNQQGSDVSISA